MNTVVVNVDPGAALPNPGTEIMSSSGVTGKKYLLKVQEVVSMRWAKDGALTVTVVARKKQIDE